MIINIWISNCFISLRAIYGTDEQKNAVHGSSSLSSAEREVRFFFPDSVLEPIPIGKLNWCKEKLFDFQHAHVSLSAQQGESEGPNEFLWGLGEHLCLHPFASSSMQKQPISGKKVIHDRISYV